MAQATDQSISWVVHTHEHRDRSVDWYWGLALLAMAGAGLSAFLGNLMLAAIIVIGAGSIVTLALRGPRLHTVKINSRGIVMDGTLYPYRSIDSFWIEPDWEPEVPGRQPRLLVSTTGILHPQLVIPVEDEKRASQVRVFLRKYAKEEEQHPHLGEHVAEIFGL